MSNVSDNTNRQAYDDVLSVLPPQQPGNKEYMQRYEFWRSVAGERHFDPFYDLYDGD